MQLLLSFDQDMKVDKLSYNSRSSTLMQLLFSFDQDMRVDKAVIQTLARQHSWNSCSLFVEIFQLRKLRTKCRLSTLQDQQNVLKIEVGAGAKELGAYEFHEIFNGISKLIT